MVRLIDLSNWIEGGMPFYPYDEKPSLIQDKLIQTDKYNNFKFEAGTHIGTHIDSPMHMTESTKFVGEYDLENFCGPACVIDVRGEEIVSYKPEYKSMVRNKNTVLLYTGFEEQYTKDIYYTNHPVIDMSFAEFLIREKIKIVGMDTPSPDKYPFEVHKCLFSNGLFIIESMRNLGRLLDVKDFEVYAFPLKIKADASWVRAIARIE